MTVTIRKICLAGGLGAAIALLSACEPGTGYVSTGVYYDSVLWNDYYYGRPRPDRPERPDRPVKPRPPIEPPVARPPIHRPPVNRPSPRPRPGGRR